MKTTRKKEEGNGHGNEGRVVDVREVNTNMGGMGGGDGVGKNNPKVNTNMGPTSAASSQKRDSSDNSNNNNKSSSSSTSSSTTTTADEKQHSTRERLLTTQLQELKVRLEEAEAIKVEQHTSILGLNDRIVALEVDGRNQSRIRDDADAKLGRAAQRVGLAFGKIMTVLGGGGDDTNNDGNNADASADAEC